VRGLILGLRQQAGAYTVEAGDFFDEFFADHGVQVWVWRVVEK
jgi:hypothetical protein